MENSLLLLDKSSDIHSILSNPENTKNKKIICFDIESTTILSELGINHELMENYVSLEDEKKIEDLALEKALSWYKNDKFEELLIFNNINLGWLLEIEFHQYLLQVMKHVIGILRIIEKEKPLKIFSSFFLNSILKSVDHENKIILKTFPKITSSEFYFDNVEIPINLGIKKINIHTSRNFALKIKKFLEQSTNLFFNLKYHDNNSKNSKILLLEFNPIQYNELMHEIYSLNDEIILLNERRPAVWNLKSLTIVKNTKSKILRLSTTSDNVLHQIDNERNDLLKKLRNYFPKIMILQAFLQLKIIHFGLQLKKILPLFAIIDF
ncbi:hypothetical protein BD31_I0464 [Candidatus Nitrosopumilus salaria BD31]|uniref:Uncharacterized protein n=1 Tax=Candidatus Nitrosopumilus salarius BD31 TaxID=859350 RepID=I3D5E7_9ARCH|nr:hypothetical protein [Candidatus Nitrosopumilus salaria]EIJ66940.1 hypothetical protein BD31_I0464 [Candidatus Nitrosopumilus salaria BD31]